MTIPTRIVPIVAVQYAPGFPSDDAGWRLNPSIIPIAGCEMIGSAVANVEMLELLGNHAPPGTSGNRVVNRPTALLSTGMAIRLLIEDAAGTISGILQQKERKFKAFWWGTVVGRGRAIEGGDATTDPFAPVRRIQWTCEDAKGTLARQRVAYSYLGSTRIDRVIPFNESLAGNCRSTSTTIDGQSVRTFDCSSSRVPWTYRKTLDYLLASHGRPQNAGLQGPVGGLTWVIDWSSSVWLGADTAWLPYLNPCDQDVLAILDRLAPISRGLSWNYTVSGQTATIRFISLSPNAINYGGLGLAANPGVDLDLRQDRFVEDLRFVKDATGADWIVVYGERPLRHVSFDFPGDLVPDDSWTTSDPADDPGSPAGITGAWRVYKISPTWDPAGGPGGSANPWVRNSISSLPSGLPDGVRSLKTPIPSVDALELTCNLGIPNSDGATGKPGGDQGPILVSNPTVAGQAEDFSDRIIPTISNCPPRIILGTSAEDSQTIKNWYDSYASSGKAFTITVGVREWSNLALGWMRAPEDWPSVTPRTLSVPVPDALEISRSNGATVGCDASGNRIGASAGGSTTFRDNLDTLRLQLALSRARYEVEGGTCTYLSRCLIDASTSGPTALGTMWAKVYGPEGTETCNAVVSGRFWDFQQMTTSYTSVRPDFLPSDRP
jgi:hypothetical protein